MSGYLKLFRKMLDWEWYHDLNTKVMFLHCLLMARWEPTEWKGQVIGRGEFPTSLPKLSQELGISVQQARTALDKLKSTGEITDRTTNKFRIITVKNYDRYQADNSQENIQITDNQQATQHQLKNKRKKEDIVCNKEAPTKHKHGEFGHVMLTDTELEKLKSVHGETDTTELIKILDEAIEAKGYRYKSHYIILRNGWAVRELADRKKKKPQANKFHNFNERDTDYDNLQKRLVAAQRGV